MRKLIAISGKKNSGKNTLGKLLFKKFKKIHPKATCEYINFSDPIKKIVRIMFPDLPEKYLTGPSKYRNEIVEYARNLPSNGVGELTVRQLLIDIGNGLGRKYNNHIWINAFANTFKKTKKSSFVIVNDCRFANEFEHLHGNGFYMIRILRNGNSNDSQDSSEVEQDTIPDSDFDYIVNNDDDLKNLNKHASNIISALS